MCLPKVISSTEPTRGGKGLISQQFHLYGFEVTLGTEDRGPNIIPKTLPMLLSARRPQDLGAVGQTLWMKTKHTFLTNSRIAQWAGKDTCLYAQVEALLFLLLFSDGLLCLETPMHFKTQVKCCLQQPLSRLQSSCPRDGASYVIVVPLSASSNENVEALTESIFLLPCSPLCSFAL